MSSNNQILVKEHKGKWYVFDNIMAESWSEKNELSIKSALKSFDSREKALEYAFDFSSGEYMADGYTEYGVVEDTLWKDDADVSLID